ncbi:MAG: phosphatidylglycerophosphatase A [Pirellulales bacterium]
MRTVSQKLAVWLAVGFGSGWAPKAPGTFGTVVGLAVAWLVGRIESPIVEAAVALGLCVAAIPVVDAAMRVLGRGKDPGCIVLDEIVAMPIVFFLIPMTSWMVVVAGFALFRLFDISKLPPAKQLERLPGGLGVMADDWAAAVYSHLALRALLWAIPSFWIA